MKMIMEFSLPEEQEQFDVASKADKYRYVLEEVAQALRRAIKYAPSDQSEEVTKAYETMRDHLYAALETEGLDL